MNGSLVSMALCAVLLPNLLFAQPSGTAAAKVVEFPVVYPNQLAVETGACHSPISSRSPARARPRWPRQCVEESNGPEVAALLRDSLLLEDSAELSRVLSAELLVVPSDVFETLVLASPEALLPSLDPLLLADEPSLLPSELDWLEFESLELD